MGWRRWSSGLAASFVGLSYGRFQVPGVAREDDPCAAATPSYPHVANSPLWLSPSTVGHALNLSTYEPPAQDDDTPFLVFTAPRAASSSFMITLSHHAHIQADLEMLTQTSTSGMPWFRGTYGWTIEARDADRTAFLRDVFEGVAPPAQRHAAARGFKVFSWHVVEAELRPFTRSRHVKKIVLRRQDTLSQFVSLCKGHELDIWGRPDDKAAAAAVADHKVAVCLDDYRHYLEKEDAWYDWLAEEARAAHPESWFVISTERLVSDPTAMLDVYAHLDVPPGEMFPPHHPYSPHTLEEKVTNYDSITDLVVEVDPTW